MEEKRIYYMYQITNLVNGKTYVGVHSTSNLEDGYMGSGAVLKRAIAKYGLESFEKRILEYFEDPQQMFEREAEVVDPAFVLRSDTYNTATGGQGFSSFNSQIANERRAWLLEHDAEFRDRYSASLKDSARPLTSEHRAKLVAARRKLQVGAAHDPAMRAEMNRRSQLPEAIEKKKKVLAERKHQQGEKNSHFGKIWITDGINSRSIPKDEPIPDGWKKGRVIKKR